MIIPGLRNSGPTHWQTWFEDIVPRSQRVEQADWEHPSLAAWAARVRAAVDADTTPVWLVAHSFGCLAAVRAGLGCADRICGALLVAPADPQRFIESTSSLQGRLAFPSLVVGSADDPWIQSAVAESWARTWGSIYRNVGHAGHINVDSGYGAWPEGLRYFEELRRGMLDRC